MSGLSAKMLVLTQGDCACIRIIGRATFTSGVNFKTLTDRLCERGCKRFILDLSECVLMDSTFLGLLAALGLRFSTGDGCQGVELFNPSARITELLETLGVLRLFAVKQGPSQADLAVEPVPQAVSSKEDITRTCIEAHKVLMGLSPENAARFKDVAQFLAEDLQKAQTL